MKRVIVTGGAGFIGSHVVDAYLEMGCEVLVLDNLSTGKIENVNPGAKFLRVDIRSKEVEDIIKDFRPHLVNHHAAQINLRKSVEEPIYDADVNIMGLLNLMEAMRKCGVKRLIFSSTGGAIYGERDDLPCSEEHFPNPISPYGIAKFSCEMYIRFYEKVCGFKPAILRYGNVYGPRQDPSGEAGVIAIFLTKMLKGEDVVIFGDGNQTRDYIYVGDVVKINVLLLENERTGVYNVGTGRETSVNELYEMLKSITGIKVGVRYAPRREGELSRSALECRKAKLELNWTPSISLEEGLRLTYEWFRSVIG